MINLETPTTAKGSEAMAGKTSAVDFREFLQAEHFRRMKVNPRYSLRAFAKFLNTDFSTLGKMMRGQRPIGKSTILKLGMRLGVSPQNLETFVIQTQEEKRTRMDSGKHYTKLTEDSFQIISDPSHFAILELIRVCSFKGEIGWVSRALGMSVADTSECVERLKRIGLLTIHEDGRWEENSEDSRVSVMDLEYTNAARRNVIKAIFAKAIQAVDEVDYSERSGTHMMFAIDSSRIAAAKKQIVRFQRDLAKFLSRGKKRDRVYQLGICLYPLSNKQEK